MGVQYRFDDEVKDDTEELVHTHTNLVLTPIDSSVDKESTPNFIRTDLKSPIDKEINSSDVNKYLLSNLPGFYVCAICALIVSILNCMTNVILYLRVKRLKNTGIASDANACVGNVSDKGRVLAETMFEELGLEGGRPVADVKLQHDRRMRPSDGEGLRELADRDLDVVAALAGLLQVKRLRLSIFDQLELLVLLLHRVDADALVPRRGGHDLLLVSLVDSLGLLL